MIQDPIVEEARTAGQAYIDSFKGDWKARLEDLRRRSEAAGRTVVSLPPKPPRVRVRQPIGGRQEVNTGHP